MRLVEAGLTLVRCLLLVGGVPLVIPESRGSAQGQKTHHEIECLPILLRCGVLWRAAVQSLQLSGLRVLSSLAAGAAEGELPGEVLVPTSLLDRLLDLIRAPDTHQEVRGKQGAGGCGTEWGAL